MHTGACKHARTHGCRLMDRQACGLVMHAANKTSMQAWHLARMHGGMLMEIRHAEKRSHQIYKHTSVNSITWHIHMCIHHLHVCTFEVVLCSCMPVHIYIFMKAWGMQASSAHANERSKAGARARSHTLCATVPAPQPAVMSTSSGQYMSYCLASRSQKPCQPRRRADKQQCPVHSLTPAA